MNATYVYHRWNMISRAHLNLLDLYAGRHVCVWVWMSFNFIAKSSSLLLDVTRKSISLKLRIFLRVMTRRPRQNRFRKTELMCVAAHKKWKLNRIEWHSPVCAKRYKNTAVIKVCNACVSVFQYVDLKWNAKEKKNKTNPNHFYTNWYRIKRNLAG